MNVTDRVRTGRCNLQLPRGGSKVNYNIGTIPLRNNRPPGRRPQHVVPYDGTRKGVLNHAGYRNPTKAQVSFCPARDDMTTIRLREIVCYMLPAKMISLTLKGQLQASVPPVDKVRGYLPTRRSPDISI